MLRISRHSEQPNSDPVKKYQRYRPIARDLMSKIMKHCVDNDNLTKSGGLLGIVQGKVFVFDDENESNALMDFALNEHLVDNKSCIARYEEAVGGTDEAEKEILEAFRSSYASLFKVVGVSRSEHTLSLHDLLDGRKDIKLTDIGFSSTAQVGLLLFLRLVPLREFNMHSGAVFVFRGDLQDYLLRKYKKLTKKLAGPSDAAKRFIAFFMLSRSEGNEVRMQ